MLHDVCAYQEIRASIHGTCGQPQLLSYRVRGKWPRNALERVTCMQPATIRTHVLGVDARPHKQYMIAIISQCDGCAQVMPTEQVSLALNSLAQK
jgi:hypothetical protein